MAVVVFENVRSVNAYYSWDPRVLTGLNAVPNHNYQHKADTIGALLVGAARISNYIDNGPWAGNPPPREVRVRLHTVRETIPRSRNVNNFCFGTISQISYANAQHQPVDGIPRALEFIGITPPGNANIATVHIEMDSWYFENYPLGFCTGMLCHEFAVHCMGDHLMGVNQLFVEGTTTGAVNGTWLPAVNPQQAGQSDHAFAACDSQPRYAEYRNTVLEVATVMHGLVGVAAAPNRVPITAGDVTDLLRCFLMDVASIQATNDHRARGLTQAQTVANCFNAHRTALRTHLGGAHVLAAYVPPTVTANTVRGNFFYLASSLAWSLLPNYSKAWWGY